MENPQPQNTSSVRKISTLKYFLCIKKPCSEIGGFFAAVLKAGLVASIAHIFFHILRMLCAHFCAFSVDFFKHFSANFLHIFLALFLTFHPHNLIHFNQPVCVFSGAAANYNICASSPSCSMNNYKCYSSLIWPKLQRLCLSDCRISSEC